MVIHKIVFFESNESYLRIFEVRLEVFVVVSAGLVARWSCRGRSVVEMVVLMLRVSRTRNEEGSTIDGSALFPP